MTVALPLALVVLVAAENQPPSSAVFDHVTTPFAGLHVRLRRADRRQSAGVTCAPTRVPFHLVRGVKPAWPPTAGAAARVTCLVGVSRGSIRPDVYR
jgi:hypothetical protein